MLPVGDNIAYLASDGFFLFNGQNSIPIGQGRIDETFFNDVNDDLTYDPDYLSRMTSANYPQQQIACWSYASINAIDGRPDVILFYNYAPNAKIRWSYAKVDHKFLVATLSQGYTLEELDNVNSSIDEIPFSLDRDWETSIKV